MNKAAADNGSHYSPTDDAVSQAQALITPRVDRQTTNGEWNMSRNTETTEAERANRDPLSDAPGAHPIGTGAGAALGGATVGAVSGLVAGPVGAAVGAVVGAVVGGLAGKAVAEDVDPTIEEDYWHTSFDTRAYAHGASFDDYGPAYLYGVSAYRQYPGGSFDDMEPNLARDWNVAAGGSKLDWADARIATREAWDRLVNRTPGTRDSH